MKKLLLWIKNRLASLFLLLALIQIVLIIFFIGRVSAWVVLLPIEIICSSVLLFLISLVIMGIIVGLIYGDNKIFPKGMPK